MERRKTLFSETDADSTIKRYTERYAQYGYSPAALGWNKDRQSVRFTALTSPFNLSGKRILDIGCGFGDLNKKLTEQYGIDYEYVGVDLVPSLINEARKRYRGKHIEFLNMDTSRLDSLGTFDVAVASGVFNHAFEETDSYGFIRETMEKAFSITELGFAFDFLSSKVDYELDHAFHSDPEKILNFAYTFSRRVVLRNDYLPFEFAVYVFKDSSIENSTGRYTN